MSALRRGEDRQPLGVRGGTFQITVGGGVSEGEVRRRGAQTYVRTTEDSPPTGTW